MNGTVCHKNDLNNIESLQPVTDLSQDNYNVRFYKIDLSVSDSSIYISGSTLIRFEVTVQQTSNIVFDFVDNYKIDSVMTDHTKTDFESDSEKMIVHLSDAGVLGQLIDVEIYYHGRGYTKGNETGIYNRIASGYGSYTWTLSEPFSARNWFPCKQILTDKADSAWVFITTDSTLRAGSNGVLTNTVNLPGGKVRYEWKTRHPIAYYLISMAVGRYDDYSFYVRDSLNGDSIPVVNYIYPESYLQQNKSNIDETANFLIFFSKIYGPYPYADEKYGHCMAPIGGAMEHQTMTTLGDFGYTLVAHELSHQWFGDYVTCSDWQDIWINEGFASYSEYLALEELDSKESAMAWMANAHNFAMQDDSGSVYVPAKDTLNEDRIFDYYLSYKKGAAILHMIREEVGNDEIFFSILRNFLSVYKNKNASGADFKNFLEQKTGRNFDNFFNQWYYGEGYPHLKISWLYKNDSLFIYSLQETSSAKTPLFDLLMPFKIIFADGTDTTLMFRQTSNYQEFSAHLPTTISNLIFDPDQWLLAKIDKFSYITENDTVPRIFTVTPNPVKTELNIWFKDEPSSYDIRLVDISGKIIYTYNSTDRLSVIDIKNFHEGVYILLIIIDNKMYSTKIVKI